MTDETKTITSKSLNTIKGSINVPMWLIAVIFLGGTGGAIGGLKNSGDSIAEHATRDEVSNVSKDLANVKDDLSDLRIDVRRIRENQLLVCAKLEVACIRE